MGADIGFVLRWWGTLFLVGAVAFPLTRILFKDWFDDGYFFAKAVGMAVVTYLVYLFGTLHVLGFTSISVLISLGLVFAGGIGLQWLSHESFRKDSGQAKVKGSQSPTIHHKLLLIFFEELFFFAALLFWAWIKGHESSIRGLEKFMDYGFTKSILDSTFFPPADMWYAGYSINYYYFGHIVMAVLTRLSGIDLAITFNLMLATIFAFTLTMSFSIGYQLMRIHANNNRACLRRQESLRMSGPFVPLISGLLTAFLVTLAGNMQTLYAFTKGYTGDNVVPFWQLLWPINEFWVKLPEGLERYWYANATRFIPFTIHEFPSYSFVVSDLHGHVLSLPFVLLAIALLIVTFVKSSHPRESEDRSFIGKADSRFHGNDRGWWVRIIFYGFLVAVLLMTNALDGPIYGALFALLFLLTPTQFSWDQWQWWKEHAIPVGFVGVTAGLTSLPFLYHFKSFVSGLAVNCPPAFLAHTKVGPILFEGVEKCQKSPLWMWWLLWGFFVYCGVWFIISKIKDRDKKSFLSIKLTQLEKILLVFFVFSLGLLIFPEFFYFKDIYPAHFRSNTMFKLGYQAFIMLSIVSAYSIVGWATGDYFALNDKKSKIARIFFFIFLTPQLFLISIYPIFSVRSYFDSLRKYQGLYGLEWLRREYPDDYAGINWMNAELARGQLIGVTRPLGTGMSSQVNQGSPTTPQARGTTMTGAPVIVEADGDSYTDYNHFSAFTGLPTVVGWAVHEWLWRSTYDVVAPRREEVRNIYESPDLVLTKQLFGKYNVRFVIVGKLEREKFKQLREAKFLSLGQRVFTYGSTAIYDVTRPGY